MKISRKEVAKVAALAGVRLDEEQHARVAYQLSTILEYMERLREVDTETVEPTYHVLPVRDALREDRVGACLPTSCAMENAPERREDFFLVPRVI